MTSVSMSLDVFNSATDHLEQCGDDCIHCVFGFEIICPFKKIVEVGKAECLDKPFRRI